MNSKFKVYKLEFSSFRKEFLVFRLPWLPSNYHLDNMAAIVDEETVVANSGVDDVSYVIAVQ